MKPFLVSLCLLETLLHALAPCVPVSEFQLDGDYLLGGLFNVHHDSDHVYHGRPEAIDCSSKLLVNSSYRRFQLMRFSVDEINNLTDLLPNISLGYEIFDHCSDSQSFPGIFNLISDNDLIQHGGESHQNRSKVIAVVGASTSTHSLTVAPLFMRNLVPMVSYAAASSVLSRIHSFPSFIRTVHPNKNIIELIVKIVQHYNWSWVAFLYIDDDYGQDGLELFLKRIEDTEICLAYTKGLNQYSDYSQVFKQIDAQRIGTIIVFVHEWTAEPLLESAIRLNVTNKVWVAVNTWSLNKKLPKVKGIKNIGTVIGFSESEVIVPGFSDFIYSSRSQTHCEHKEHSFCNQACNCSGLSAEDVIAADPSFNFNVYSAVYAIAHALHHVLQCESDTCNPNITVYPHMVFAELMKSNFTLLNQSIRFDEYGDPNYGSFSIVFWNQSGDAEVIGFYNLYPPFHFFINDSKIQWYTKGEVPTLPCSPECAEGYAKKYNQIQKCCFDCEICPDGTYVNSTVGYHICEDWAAAGGLGCTGCTHLLRCSTTDPAGACSE
ncbi:taste receptor type 1 member 1-like [Etheostoma cragini]|uniref:taste receptor type 1 member 1-like n=1 Tax=Etheostoma cragini TaxID=417921 RepID=UPI00155EDEC6|nr:taste receptor type 1 member 1-like [Etheostoma cragini]